MKRTIGSGFEGLEKREMFATSVFVNVQQRALVITGDSGANHVTVTMPTPQTVNVVADGRQFDIDATNLDRIFARLGRGNDRFIESASVRLDTTVYAGRGNDLVVTGAGDDELHGGRGRDRMNGRTGSDTFYAGDGERDNLVNLSKLDTVITSDTLRVHAKERIFSVSNRVRFQAKRDLYFQWAPIAGYPDRIGYRVRIDGVWSAQYQAANTVEGAVPLKTGRIRIDPQLLAALNNADHTWFQKVRVA